MFVLQDAINFLTLLEQKMGNVKISWNLNFKCRFLIFIIYNIKTCCRISESRKIIFFPCLVFRLNETSLLSCSLDKSMIVWKFDPDSGMWIETVRVGEVGGNTLGFLGCDFRFDGQLLLGYNFTG